MIIIDLKPSCGLPPDRAQACLDVSMEITELIYARVRDGKLTLAEAVDVLKSTTHALITANQIAIDNGKGEFVHTILKLKEIPDAE